MANYTSVTATNICDAAGNKLASGTVSFQATDAANQPLNFQVGGGGQVVTTPATAAIVAGAIAGGFQVADSANTSPAGILYRITITDTTLNRVVVTYSLVTVTGTTFNLDNFSQTGAAVLPPVGGSVTGPLTVAGNLNVTGSYGTIAAKNIEGVRYVEQFTGADVGAQINAAIADAPAGGVVDARAISTPQTCSTSITLNKSITLLFGPATFTMGSTQILITSSAARVIGSGSNGFGGNGTTFIYSGTAPFIDAGDGTNSIFHTVLKGFCIQSSGSAVLSATAMGIRFRNSKYAILDEISIGGNGTGFEGGVGIEFRATASSFDATNHIYNPALFDNFYGIHLVGANTTNSANDLKIYGGFVIAHSPTPANSYGIFGDQFSDGIKVYGTDVESYADNYHFSGTSSNNHSLYAARSEFPTQNHWYVGAGSTGVQMYGFTPESPGYSNAGTLSGGAPNGYTDLGTNTQAIDRYGYKGYGLTIQPSTDHTEILSINKANGTVFFDISDNIASPRVELVNGCDLNVYSDSFSTLKFHVNGATGNTNVSGTLGVTGTSTFGTGTPLARYARYSLTLSPAAVAANTTAEQSFASSVTSGDVIIGISKPTTQAGLGIVGHRASGTTLFITFSNNTASPITPTASEVYQVVAVQ